MHKKCIMNFLYIIDRGDSLKGIIYLEEGTIYTGKGFGKLGTSVGELVFNTSMTGYQEILTDPSYAGQIITMTYPFIGNYGVNSFESESSKVQAKGFIIKNISNYASNYKSEETIDKLLEDAGVVGIYDVDTRKITKKIRNIGVVKCVISNEDLSVERYKSMLKGTLIRNDYIDEVSTKEIIHIEGSGPKVALMDFGVKKNIVNNLKMRGCDIRILPYDTNYDTIASLNIDGVLLSNGPGDPMDIYKCTNTIKKIIYDYPTFGICMGHQILALACGGSTYKMKFGHRGSNHGVFDIEKDKAYITSQNHGYAVDLDSVKANDMVLTHINLNDNTVEGMRHKDLPVFSVQFHPEGSPGPIDSSYLFDKFITSMNNK
jgi:carbamoyl-phosphate synthase small subunit